MTVEAIIVRKHIRKPAEILGSVRKEQEIFAQKLITRMRRYPAQIPGTRYVRTFALQGGWTSYADGRDVVVSNQVKYAGDVEGEAPGVQKEEFGVKRHWPAINKAAETILKERMPQLRRAVRVVY